MFKLSFFTALMLLTVVTVAQSPHGKNLRFDCVLCHTTENWKIKPVRQAFHHDSTDFPLLGQHKKIDCKLCHPSLVFEEAKKECADCHQDMHQNTVGYDCERCHTNESFVVKNITRVHQNSRFPLLGVHLVTDCSECHPSASNLQFNNLGTQCADCHLDNYMSTTNPSHIQSGFSQNCFECHSQSAISWDNGGFNHDFFPLTLGHSNLECLQCHTDGNYSKIQADCFSCHEDDYQSALVPNHQTSGFSQVCTECHTTHPDWKPAEYKQHDYSNFPIYSGKHKGKWDNCTECHTAEGNYGVFSCLECHEHNKTSMDNQHRGRKDYRYESSACYSCHPKGRSED